MPNESAVSRRSWRLLPGALVLLALPACATGGGSQQAASRAKEPVAPATDAATAAAEPAKAPGCVVMLATTEPAGLDEERRWLHDHFPGWKMNSQSLGFSEEGKAFDHISVTTPDGATHEICFDITSFFGHY